MGRSKRVPKIIGATEWWRCCVCNDWKLPSNYRKASRFSSGLVGRCKDCDILAGYREYMRIGSDKQQARKMKLRIPKDMNHKRLGLMNKHRAGNDTLLSYDEFDDIPDITDIDKEKK